MLTLPQRHPRHHVTQTHRAAKPCGPWKPPGCHSRRRRLAGAWSQRASSWTRMTGGIHLHRLSTRSFKPSIKGYKMPLMAHVLPRGWLSLFGSLYQSFLMKACNYCNSLMPCGRTRCLFEPERSLWTSCEFTSSRRSHWMPTEEVSWHAAKPLGDLNQDSTKAESCSGPNTHQMSWHVMTKGQVVMFNIPVELCKFQASCLFMSMSLVSKLEIGKHWKLSINFPTWWMFVYSTHMTKIWRKTSWTTNDMQSKLNYFR